MLQRNTRLCWTTAEEWGPERLWQFCILPINRQQMTRATCLSTQTSHVNLIAVWSLAWLYGFYLAVAVRFFPNWRYMNICYPGQQHVNVSFSFRQGAIFALFLMCTRRHCNGWIQEGNGSRLWMSVVLPWGIQSGLSSLHLVKSADALRCHLRSHPITRSWIAIWILLFAYHLLVPDTLSTSSH